MEKIWCCALFKGAPSQRACDLVVDILCPQKKRRIDESPFVFTCSSNKYCLLTVCLTMSKAARLGMANGPAGQER